MLDSASGNRIDRCVPEFSWPWTVGKEIESFSHSSRLDLLAILSADQSPDVLCDRCALSGAAAAAGGLVVRWHYGKLTARAAPTVDEYASGEGVVNPTLQSHDHSSLPSLTRRSFLTRSLGVLMLSCAVWAEERRAGRVALNAWLQIAADNTITVVLSQSEMGQGISTTLPVALADELGADWSMVRTEWSPFDPAYRHPQYGWMFTGNSESSSTFYPVMRTMGAAAREMLVQAAATRLNVGPNSLVVQGGVIRDPVSGRSLRFGEVAEAAAKLPVPSAPRLKSAAELTMIGKPQARFDIPPKVDGSAVFGIDVKIPGMAVAALRRAMTWGLPEPSTAAASPPAAPVRYTWRGNRSDRARCHSRRPKADPSPPSRGCPQIGLIQSNRRGLSTRSRNAAIANRE